MLCCQIIVYSLILISLTFTYILKNEVNKLGKCILSESRVTEVSYYHSNFGAEALIFLAFVHYFIVIKY